MKNAWIDEIEIKDAVDELSSELRNTFLGCPGEPSRWGEYLMHYLFTWYHDKPRIRDAILTRYTFIYECDDNEMLVWLNLTKLPWII